MPADEKVRVVTLDESPRADVVMPRITPDMGHQHLHPAAFEILMSGINGADILPVAVPVNSHKRLEIRELLGEFSIPAEVSGVPELLHRLQEFAELIGEESVRVRKKSYIHNEKKRARRPPATPDKSPIKNL